MLIVFVFRKLAGKVIYVTGGSRGIGLAMAIKAAKDGAKVAIAAKTADPHPKVRHFTTHDYGVTRTISAHYRFDG